MKKYQIQFVYQQLTLAQQQQIIEMWLQSGVLNRETAEQRVKEVSTLVFDQYGELAGVSTVYPADFTSPNNPYFFFRIFIKPSARGSYILLDDVTKVNYANLKKEYANRCHGLVVELENLKFDGLGKRTTYFSKRGYSYQGKSARGLQLWYVRFDEPRGIYVGI